MTDWYPVLVGLVIGAMTMAAFLAGKGSGNLARMEVTAAVQVAKQEVGWEYQRYRIEAMRMDWVNLSPEARKEYVRTWARPKWASDAVDRDPMLGVPKVHMVRGPSQ